MKIVSALLFSALSIQAYGATSDGSDSFAPPPGTTTIGGDEALTLINALIDSGIPSDNSKPNKLEVNVGSIDCTLKIVANPEKTSCTIQQSGKNFPTVATAILPLYAVFTAHDALKTQSDGSILTGAHDVNCSKPVPDNGTASCNLTFN